jgi:hypothetical protein
MNGKKNTRLTCRSNSFLEKMDPKKLSAPHFLPSLGRTWRWLIQWSDAPRCSAAHCVDRTPQGSFRTGFRIFPPQTTKIMGVDPTKWMISPEKLRNSAWQVHIFRAVESRIWTTFPTSVHPRAGQLKIAMLQSFPKRTGNVDDALVLTHHFPPQQQMHRFSGDPLGVHVDVSCHRCVLYLVASCHVMWVCLKIGYL